VPGTPNVGVNFLLQQSSVALQSVCYPLYLTPNRQMDSAAWSPPPRATRADEIVTAAVSNMATAVSVGNLNARGD